MICNTRPKSFSRRRNMNAIAHQRQIGPPPPQSSVDNILGEKGYDTNRRLQSASLKEALHKAKRKLARFETSGSGPEVLPETSF